jgi:predicted secreted Zn-dependent protease
VFLPRTDLPKGSVRTVAQRLRPIGSAKRIGFNGFLAGFCGVWRHEALHNEHARAMQMSGRGCLGLALSQRGSTEKRKKEINAYSLGFIMSLLILSKP